MKALLITIVMALFVISCTTGTSEIDSSLTCGTGVAQTIYGNMFYQCCREWWVGDSFYRYCCGFALSSGAGYGHGPVTCGPNYIFRG